MKKLLAVIVLMMAVMLFAQSPQAKNGITTGTTTNAVTKVTFDVGADTDSLFVGRYTNKMIKVVNTGSASKDISYWVYCYVSKGDTTPITFASATDLSDDAIAVCDINATYYKIVVEVESTVDGDHSTYQVTWALRYQ